MSLAHKLKRLRVQKHLTQDQLAPALRLSRLSINQLENGKRNLTANVAVRYGIYFGVKAISLLRLQMGEDLVRALDDPELKRIKP